MMGMAKQVRLWNVSKQSELRELSQSRLDLEAPLEEWLAQIPILDVLT